MLVPTHTYFPASVLRAFVIINFPPRIWGAERRKVRGKLFWKKNQTNKQTRQNYRMRDTESGDVTGNGSLQLLPKISGHQKAFTRSRAHYGARSIMHRQTWDKHSLPEESFSSGDSLIRSHRERSRHWLHRLASSHPAAIQSPIKHFHKSWDMRPCSTQLKSIHCISGGPDTIFSLPIGYQ